jgi:hypothetical protein
MEIFDAWHALHFNVLIKAQGLPPWWNLGPNNTQNNLGHMIHLGHDVISW